MRTSDYALCASDMDSCKLNCFKGITWDDCKKCCSIKDEECRSRTSPPYFQCGQENNECLIDCNHGIIKYAEQEKAAAENIPVVDSAQEFCKQNCGIDFGKCLIQTFDMALCTKNEASCALDCLKGIAFVAKYDKPIVKNIPKVEGIIEACNEGCISDYNQCIL